MALTCETPGGGETSGGDAFAERGHLRLGLRHQPGDAAADGGAVRHAREVERAAQRRVPREQLLQL